MTTSDPLDLLLPPVRQWFRNALGEPTPAQQQGWPAIAAGQHTLILAPTGSGKTLAAFLACLDQLWRQDPPPPGVRVLYVSPLKALNNDIHRNLQIPLDGVAETARQMGQPLPELTVAVRTGDTSTAERQRMVRRPPHVLITTPESLHLLLTSRARETLRNVSHCIVDEIHSLAPNKRGVFLSLLLERLQALTPHGFVRIGLSATQRPLDDVARFLGGLERPVTCIDAGLRKDLDLRVVSPVEHFGPQPERSIWPAIYRLLGEEVRQHRSTIVFTNNRRAAERITAHLNDSRARGQGSGDRAQEVGRLTPDPWPLTPVELARAHHGSVALEVRRQTEEALKEGRLKAAVATASLELGIDMGAVELVCQVESPGSVARGLQRVGRAGHLVGQRSKGRLIPKTPPDLLEQAVLAREMAAGRVEAIRVPINCLDVLAQQVVAAVSVDSWDVPAMYALVRRAYPYRDLSPEAFEAVLEMVSGRFRFTPEGDASGSLTALQPRVSWDRVHNRLHALPGSRQMALVNGGTIPDTGQYAVYTSGGVRIGELDEEFVYERRIGDTFLLGTNAWRLDRVQTDRVIVVPAEGAPAMVPFWHGERAGRSYDLGVAIGRFLRELNERLDSPDCVRWLEEEFFLDPAAARNLRAYVRRQRESTSSLPTDQTLVVEAARDPLGDWQVVLLSPFGNRVNLALRLAIEAMLRRRLGYGPQCLHHDDGLLIRLTDTDVPVLDLFEGLTPENVEGLILEELADSALFALRFRQNASRSLLLPRMRPGRRAPLWLQRMRGRDLLQVARRHPNFPIVVETFRECLHDHLDLPRVQQILADVAAGRLKVVARRPDAPSPFAANLLFAFTMGYMYQYDGVEAEPARVPALDGRLLGQLVAPDAQGHLLDPRAVHQVERRLRGLGQPPRTAAEMAEWLRRLGDVSAGDLEGPMAAFLEELETDGRARRIQLPRVREPERWVLAEEEPTYRRAFGLETAEPDAVQEAAETILRRFIETHALVGLQDVLDRYPFEQVWARRQIEAWAQSGRVVRVEPGAADGASVTEDVPPRWSVPDNLEQVQRSSLALLRREVVTCPPMQFAHFVLRWQHVQTAGRSREPSGASEALADILTRLQGLPLPAELWEQTVFPARVPGYQPRALDEEIATGGWTWVCQNPGADGPGLLAFLGREHLPQLPVPLLPDTPALDDNAERVRDALHRRGALFVADLAHETGLPPSTVRAGLWSLLRRSLVTNDHFDVIRRGEEAARPPERPSGLITRLPGDLRRVAVSPRRRATASAEGRWSLLPWGRPEPEAHAVYQASVLLTRYGIVARELALLDPWMPPWRVLYEVLSRMELAGDVRRGYFVEGLSGAQFALPEAARMLQEMDLPSTAAAPVVLLHSLDPANLYGSGAPFDVPLLDGGTRPLVRRAGNALVLRAGRPVLLIEQQGRRLTALASASRDDLAAAVACLPGLLSGLGPRGKVTVEEWNGEPVTTSAGREVLEAAGFVRDYQSLTLYGTWQ
jgi:ATP-dependent Lhr-like helicase